jgi:hypothetical protein
MRVELTATSLTELDLPLDGAAPTARSTPQPPGKSIFRTRAISFCADGQRG